MVPGNVKRLKIAKMLDTLLLGKILLKDAEREYVPTVPQKIFQKTPKKTPKKHPKNTHQKASPKSTQKTSQEKTSKIFQKNP